MIGPLPARRPDWEVSEAVAGTVLEIRQELESQLLVVRFFDRAIYHTVRGYEEKAAA